MQETHLTKVLCSDQPEITYAYVGETLRIRPLLRTFHRITPLTWETHSLNTT